MRFTKDLVVIVAAVAMVSVAMIALYLYVQQLAMVPEASQVEVIVKHATNTPATTTP